MMPVDPFLQNEVLYDPIYNCNNFYTTTDDEKQELLCVIHRTVQCIIIDSNVGMGGTHLLAVFYKVLKKYSTSIDYQKLLYKHNKEGVTSLNLQGYKYLFLDDWYALYNNRGKSNKKLIKLVESEIDNFIKKGGKVFMKINSSQTTTSLFVYLSNFTTEEVILDSVEKPVQKKIMEAIFESNGFVLEKEVEDKLLSGQYHSYRYFQYTLIMWIVENKMGKTNVAENKNLD